MRNFGLREISRARMTFWMLPPESEPAAAFTLAQRMSNCSRSACAFLSMDLLEMTPARENGALPTSLSTRFSRMDMEGTMPSTLRSSGT